MRYRCNRSQEPTAATSRRYFVLLALSTLILLSPAATVKDREAAVRKDRAMLANDSRWIYNDFQRGFQEAKRVPLLFENYSRDAVERVLTRFGGGIAALAFFIHLADRSMRLRGWPELQEACFRNAREFPRSAGSGLHELICRPALVGSFQR